jgi:hypothetical protein
VAVGRALVGDVGIKIEVLEVVVADVETGDEVVVDGV